MKHRLAVASGFIFSIAWPRIHPPPTSSTRLRVLRASSNSTTTPSSNLADSLASKMPEITYDLLAKQNAETSNALIDYWSGGSSSVKDMVLKVLTCGKEQPNAFQVLSQYEGNLTKTRDEQDEEKLAKGIAFAKEKGVIDPHYVPEPYIELDVLGKSPDVVANEIIHHVRSKSNMDTGKVIVLCGLSGTGKGTTVSKLKQELEAEGRKVVTWSNGNIFRSVTLLAATWCEQNGCDGFDKEKALTKENVEMFMNMLTFGKFHGKFDIRIHGLGFNNVFVSDIQNTELKGPRVSKNIPTVAEFTQGEVILFASNAVGIMGREDGCVVLLEGREQTVNYVRTPHRFTLVLSDESLIGKRRTAQRIMAAALKELQPDATPEQVETALQTCLQNMIQEME